jgi:2'-5' RNA ligase
MTPDLLHITLVFLGGTDSARVPALESALVAVASRHDAYAARTGEAGARLDDRPNGRRGGVAWLRLADGGHQTAQLALDVDAALGKNVYDDRHAPRPHLTVARNVHRPAFDALRDLARGLEVGWLTTQLVLFRSYTSRHGSQYEPLSTWPLRPHDS